MDSYDSGFKIFFLTNFVIYIHTVVRHDSIIGTAINYFQIQMEIAAMLAISAISVIYPLDYLILDIEFTFLIRNQCHFKCRKTHFKVAEIKEIIKIAPEIIWKVPFLNKVIIVLNSISK